MTKKKKKMPTKPKLTQKFPRMAEVKGIPLGVVYPWKEGDYVCVLGELENMPGHYVIAHKGLVHDGYHDDFFVDIPE